MELLPTPTAVFMDLIPIKEKPMLPNISLTRLNGETEQMSDYAGKVLLIVNVASRCGFTNQYAGLQNIYAQFQDRGLKVLGFPCNQFGGQEPGSATEIEQFCSTRYRTTFPLFEKTDVNGENAHPLYKYIKHAAPGILGTEAIKWNFTKFLVDRQGQVVRRYGSADDPASIANDIQKILQSPE
jgi:glutathione peroxidase